MLVLLERAQSALQTYGAESDALDRELRGAADALTELHRLSRGQAMYCIDERQTEHLVLTALASPRSSVVASAVELIKGCPVREGLLAEHIFFGLFQRLSEMLGDRATYGTLTLQHAAAAIPRFLTVESLSVATILIACSNGLATALVKLVSVSTRTTLYGNEEEALQALQQKAAYCLWFLFANIGLTGNQEEEHKETFFNEMTSTGALRRLVHLCSSEYDNGRVQRMALKTLHSFFKLSDKAAEAVLKTGGLEMATKVVGDTGPLGKAAGCPVIRQENFRQATLLCADLVLASEALEEACRSHGRSMSTASVDFPNLTAAVMRTAAAPNPEPPSPAGRSAPASESGTPTNGRGVEYDYPDFHTWPTKELKAYLKAGAINSSGCYEKGELVTLAKLRYRRMNHPTNGCVTPSEAASTPQGCTTPVAHALSDGESLAATPHGCTTPTYSHLPPGSPTGALPVADVVGARGMARDISFDVSEASDGGSSHSATPLADRVAATISSVKVRLDDSHKLGGSSTSTPRRTAHVRAYAFEVPNSPAAAAGGGGGGNPVPASRSPFAAAAHVPFGSCGSMSGGAAAAAVLADAAAAQRAAEIAKMSVAQLKKMLAKARVDYSQCVEKKELVALAQQLPEHLVQYAMGGDTPPAPGAARTRTRTASVSERPLTPRVECPSFNSQPLKDEEWYGMADVLVDVLSAQARFNKHKALSLSALCGVPPTALTSPSAKSLSAIKCSLKLRIGLQRILTSNFLTDVLVDAVDKERNALAASGLLRATALQLMSQDVDLIAPSMTALAHFAESPAVASSIWTQGILHPVLHVLLGLAPEPTLGNVMSKEYTALVACLRLLSNVCMVPGLSESGDALPAQQPSGQDPTTRRAADWLSQTGGMFRVHEVLRAVLAAPGHMAAIKTQFKYLPPKQQVLKYPGYQCVRVLRHMAQASPYSVPHAILAMPHFMETGVALCNGNSLPPEVLRAGAQLMMLLTRCVRGDKALAEQVQVLQQLAVLANANGNAQPV